MVIHKNKDETQRSEQQLGTTLVLPQLSSCGMEKSKEAMSKPTKTPKINAADSPRDMGYYAQKLAGSPVPMNTAEVKDRAVGEAPGREEKGGDLALVAITDQPGPPAAKLEEGKEEGEKSKQPTLAEILRAVNICTASVNTLQACFRGLKEEVVLIRQDLQKNQGKNNHY